MALEQDHVRINFGSFSYKVEALWLGEEDHC